MKPTMQDVAELARVSRATVSRVINGNPNVTEETRKAVLDAAAKLGYEFPRKSKTLPSVLVTAHQLTLRDPFFLPVLEGLESACRSRKFSLSISTFQNCTTEACPSVCDADGIILLGSAGITDHILDQLAEQGVPTVLVNSAVRRGDFPYVGTEDQAAMYGVTQTLIEKNHQRIAFISGPADDRINLDRLQGYRLALLERGLDVSPQLISDPGDWSIESGYNNARKLISQLKKAPTAIVAANDRMALGAYRAIKELGLRIPDDISVIGFDDIEMAQHADPPLSTVSVPQVALGQWGIQLLATMMEVPSLTPTRLYVSTRLVLRESVAPVTSS